MRVEVLGCSGGIGGRRRTSALRVDQDILLDCGTGVGDMSSEDLAGIRHVFLTHSHLDHVACLPMLVDTLFAELTREPLTVYATGACIEILQNHIFNWQIWPDFQTLPAPDSPVVRFQVMEPGEVLSLRGRRIEMLPVVHTVPACGYRVQEEGGGAFAYSGDCTTNDGLWAALNASDTLDLLVVECAFGDGEMDLARRAGHYCPQLLVEDLAKLGHDPRICITHLKPGEEARVFAQLRERAPGRALVQLRGGEVFRV
ncbi:MAG TPA: 3',5'-cyclic-nucleotide phosphodiesterase [Thioalkalivibrio sp.]|nr:3',5'-cyclic-nucleotide phosphodiesterase [Thioalkalivibrio sp.]